MKKIKLLKTILIPSLSALTLGTIATVATSCGEQPKPSTYSVSGGSEKLKGVHGTAGSDEKTWELIKEGTKVTESVTWSIVEPVTGVFISKGRVSGTNAIPSGTYNFKVAATYNGQTYLSTDITLVINAAGYKVEGGSLLLSGEYNTAGSDEETWVLTKDGEVITDGVTWSIVDPIAGVSINNGKVSWTDTIPFGNYSFLVKATYGDETYASEDITLTISSKSEVTGGSTSLTGFESVSGSDEKTWVFKRDGEIQTNVTWSIVEPVEGISITDGKVSWTDNIPVGNYSFFVRATYGDETFNSEVVTLTITTEYNVEHGSTQLFGTYGNEGFDEKNWVLKKDGKVITKGVTWSIVEPVSGVSINDGKVSWSNAMEIGTYSFKVAAAYNEQAYLSTDITLVINDAGYKVEGGSLALNGVYGTAGSDENEWKLFTDGQEVTEGVTWSIADPVGGVSINDGKVSWAGAIQGGTFKFKVVAIYKGQMFASNTITLTINAVYQFVGENKTIDFVATNTGRDIGNKWHLIKDDETVSEGVIWSLVPAAGSSVPEWIKLNENNEISWTNAVEGTYSFKIQAEYDGKTFTSSDPFVLNVGAKVFECVEVLANENSTLVLENAAPGISLNLSYSFNGFGWNSYTSPISIPEDQTLYLRGWNPEGWSKDDSWYSYFNIAGDVSISGNVMGLLDDGTRAVRDIPCGYCFYRLFYRSYGVTSVSDNFLPSLNLKHNCYNDMFESCTLLANVPELPATTLAVNCYNSMFFNCTSLTKAPALPAMELEDFCYSKMFNGCTSLNSVKIGYKQLVSDAPVGAFNNWVDGVAETGTFYYNGPDYVHASLFYFPPLWYTRHY